MGRARLYSGLISSPVGGLNDHSLALALASDTGERLAQLRFDLERDGRFGGPSGPMGLWPEDQGDALGHDLLMQALGSARPDDAILSEEGTDDGSRVDHRRVWIVDPLDGSSDYGQGSSDWAIHVALVEDGRGVAAAVSLPALGVVFATDSAPVLPESNDERPVVVTGRSRVRRDGVRVARGLDADLMTCGSAGVKAMLVAAGQADVYVHAGPLWEWDVCAPAIVAQAAGLHVSDAQGNELVFNKERPVAPGFVVCRPEYASRVLELID